MTSFFDFLTFDFVLLIVLLGFVGWGFGHGLIRAVGGIIGIIIAAFLASHYYLWLADIIDGLFGSFQGLARIVSFTLIFLVVGRLFGYVVLLIERAFDILAFLPFLKSINRLAGALFGFIFGVLVLGTLLYVIGKYSQWTTLNDAAATSQLAQYVLSSSAILRPLFPDALRQLQSYF
ncbi:MAG: CvpA family protein [Patescibacteria group bacterium]|jgi:uncharacterized membrane protein required for colicin V production